MLIEKYFDKAVQDMQELILNLTEALLMRKILLEKVLQNV